MTKSSDPYALLVAVVFKAAGEMRRSGDAIAAQVGQTQARWQLMWIISQGPLTVPDAAHELGVTRQSVQRIADELVADGMAEFVANPRHQRSSLLRLTRHGEQALEQISVAARRFNQKMVRLFTAEQLNGARELLDRIVVELRGA